MLIIRGNPKGLLLSLPSPSPPSVPPASPPPPPPPSHLTPPPLFPLFTSPLSSFSVLHFIFDHTKQI